MTSTVFEQTGWAGTLPETICQETDILLAITEYDYDTEDPGFVQYCLDRGCWYRVHEEGSISYQFVHHCDWGESAYMKCKQTTIEPYNTLLHPEELKVMWQGVLAARGALQDCWEIYTFRR